MSGRNTTGRRRSFGLGLLLMAGAIAGCGGTDEKRPAVWSFIAPAIIEPSCATASCHSSVAARADVVLDTADKGFSTLTTRRFVIPGSPETSEIIFLMRAAGARRMPPDFALPDIDIQLIETWIREGAEKN